MARNCHVPALGDQPSQIGAHGFGAGQDDQIGCRNGLIRPDEAKVDLRVQTQGVGPFSVGYGWDSYKAQAGLTEGEKVAFDRAWPSVPQIIAMGSPAGPGRRPWDRF